MNNCCFLVRVSIVPVLLFSLHASASSPAYMLDLKAPRNVNTDGIYCLYHGVPLTFKDEYCILPESTARHFFVLVVTPRIEFVKKGSLTTLRCVKNLPCVRYLLTLEHTKKTDGSPSYTWHIEKPAEEDMPLRIPEKSSIILCLDPSVVEGLKNTHVGTRVIHLPTILLKDNVTQRQLNSACEGACCFLPEVRSCCCEESCACQCTDKTVTVQTEKSSCLID